MKEKIKEILSRRQKKAVVDDGLTPAAVMLPLFECEDGDYHILFTKRTQKVEHHKGQISFPGGAYNQADVTLQTTALRESLEEIGVGIEDVEILGELDDIVTSSNFIVSPFVAAIPYPYSFKVNEEEVEELIDVPLSALLDKNRANEIHKAGEGTPLLDYSYPYGDHLIWGVTARILKQFLDIAFDIK